MSRPLGEEYFTRYGVNSAGVRKTDYSRNWRHFTFSLPEILRIYKKRLGKPPRTFLDIGAADGRFMEEARSRGLKVRGIENSPYILAQIRDRSLRARIRVGNAADLIRDFEPGAFDIILECAAQYLPPRRLDRYLKNLARLRPGMVCLLVDPRNYQGDRGSAHTGVRTFETITWWKKKMEETGFRRSSHDFFFFAPRTGDDVI
jgi:hypothetical protein